MSECNFSHSKPLLLGLMHQRQPTSRVAPNFSQYLKHGFPEASNTKTLPSLASDVEYPFKGTAFPRRGIITAWIWKSCLTEQMLWKRAVVWEKRPSYPRLDSSLLDLWRTHIFLYFKSQPLTRTTATHAQSHSFSFVILMFCLLNYWEVGSLLNSHYCGTQQMGKN